MKLKHKDYGFFFWVHLLIMIFLLLAWLFVSWWMVILMGFLLQIQYRLIGGCIISKFEFHNKKACTEYYLEKWKVIKNKKVTQILIDYVLPILNTGLALLWQVLLGNNPLIF